MDKVFDYQKVDSMLSSAGLSQAAVARELGVSREAVSKWFSGENVPRPRHRALLAALLNISLRTLAGEDTAVREPVIAYRVKGKRKVRAEQSQWFRRDMQWLEKLEHRMGRSGWIRGLPEYHGAPSGQQAALLAADFRRDLDLEEQDETILGHRLLRWLATHGIVLVPVFWGGRRNPVHAMHVRFPDSDTHWLYLNLDAAVLDVRFWIVHEIAHMIRRRAHDPDDAEERFADSFAAEVLFPASQAASCVDLVAGRAPDEQLRIMRRLAHARTISIVTVYLQINRILEAAGKERLALDGMVYPLAKQACQHAPTWADGLFGGRAPDAEQFVRICAQRLNTPLFRLAAEEIRENDRGIGFVERVFQVASSDAESLLQALREYDAEKNTG